MTPETLTTPVASAWLAGVVWGRCCALGVAGLALWLALPACCVLGLLGRDLSSGCGRDVGAGGAVLGGLLTEGAAPVAARLQSAFCVAALEAAARKKAWIFVLLAAL